MTPRVRLERGSVGRPRGPRLIALLALEVGESDLFSGNYANIRQSAVYAFGHRGYRIRRDGDAWRVTRRA